MSPSGLCRVLSVLARFSRPISPFTGDIVLTPSIQPIPRDEPLPVHRRQANGSSRLQKALCQAYIDLLRESLRKPRYPWHSTDPPVALLYADKTILGNW